MSLPSPFSICGPPTKGDGRLLSSYCFVWLLFIGINFFFLSDCIQMWRKWSILAFNSTAYFSLGKLPTSSTVAFAHALDMLVLVSGRGEFCLVLDSNPQDPCHALRSFVLPSVFPTSPPHAFLFVPFWVNFWWLPFDEPKHQQQEFHLEFEPNFDFLVVTTCILGIEELILFFLGSIPEELMGFNETKLQYLWWCWLMILWIREESYA